jgi:IS30 family transposase
MLVEMIDATATSSTEGFRVALNGMLLAMRKSATYDHAREMARYAEITQKTGITTYLCDPHNPHYGSNEKSTV